MSRTKNKALHDERRQQILAAAAAVFQEKGFQGARTKEICARAGLSAGTVFRHFRTKEEIIATIAELEFAAGTECIRHLGTREGFCWMARMTVKDWPILLPESRYKLGADAWLELSRNPKYRGKVVKLDCSMRAILGKAMRKGQKEGWVRRELEPMGTASLLVSLFVGLIMDAQTNRELNWSAKAKAMGDLIRSYVLAKGVI